MAIPGYGVPILQCLIPLAARHATSLNALLTLALQFRSSNALKQGTREPIPGDIASGRHSPEVELDSYHQAITNLRSSLSRLQSGQGDIEEAIAVSMVLWIFGLPDHDIWSIHLNGLIALLEATPLSASDARFPSALHKFATMTAAHLDIKAISIGRSEISQRLWLRWQLCSPDNILTLPAEGKAFSGWEISSGYPESLMTIIALVSTILEDDASGNETDSVCATYLDRLAFQTSQAGPTVSPVYHNTRLDMRNQKLISLMETVITQWKPPSIPDSMPVEPSIALSAMWEAMRKATMIYLWRGGFETDITVPLSREQEISVHRFAREMCGCIEQVIQAAEKFHIPMANSLIWPLAVIGNEASSSPELQGKIREYLGRIYTYFLIPHHKMVDTLLQKLWNNALEEKFGVSGAPVCLHSICLEENVRLPLL